MCYWEENVSKQIEIPYWFCCQYPLINYPVMDAGLHLIAKNSPHLRQLYLRRCINITGKIYYYYWLMMLFVYCYSAIYSEKYIVARYTNIFFIFVIHYEWCTWYQSFAGSFPIIDSSSAVQSSLGELTLSILIGLWPIILVQEV